MSAVSGFRWMVCALLLVPAMPNATAEDPSSCELSVTQGVGPITMNPITLVSDRNAIGAKVYVLRPGSFNSDEYAAIVQCSGLVEQLVGCVEQASQDVKTFLKCIGVLD